MAFMQLFACACLRAPKMDTERGDGWRATPRMAKGFDPEEQRTFAQRREKREEKWSLVALEGGRLWLFLVLEFFLVWAFWLSAALAGFDVWVVVSGSFWFRRSFWFWLCCRRLLFPVFASGWSSVALAGFGVLSGVRFWVVVGCTFWFWRLGGRRRLCLVLALFPVLAFGLSPVALSGLDVWVVVGGSFCFWRSSWFLLLGCRRLLFLALASGWSSVVLSGFGVLSGLAFGWRSAALSSFGVWVGVGVFFLPFAFFLVFAFGRASVALSGVGAWVYSNEKQLRKSR